jgi:hypothetical protein
MQATRFAAAAFAALWLMAGTAVAAPDFSGNWKINVAKSDLGQMPAPEKWDSVIRHKDPELKVSTTMVTQMGERTIEAAYRTDGVETESIRGEMKAKSTAKWEGEALSIVSKMTTQGGDMTITEKWTLGEDGKTMTVHSKWSSDRGEFEFKRVMDKQ